MVSNLVYTCGVCRGLQLAEALIEFRPTAMLTCPQCGTVYVWHRLRGQKRAGWSQPCSCVELVLFPLCLREEDAACLAERAAIWRRRAEFARTGEGALPI